MNRRSTGKKGAGFILLKEAINAKSMNHQY